MRFLREFAPGARIEAEYRHSGTTADIYFKWEGFLSTGEIFIELKRNLRQKPQLDRLIGQLEQLDPGKHKIIVVLCGKTNETLLSRFKKKYRRYWEGLETQMVILVKPESKGATA